MQGVLQLFLALALCELCQEFPLSLYRNSELVVTTSFMSQSACSTHLWYTYCLHSWVRGS